MLTIGLKPPSAFLSLGKNSCLVLAGGALVVVGELRAAADAGAATLAGAVATGVRAVEERSW